MCTHIHTYTPIYVHTHTHIQLSAVDVDIAHTHAPTYPHTHPHTHPHPHTHAHSHAHTHAHAHTHRWTSEVCAYTDVYFQYIPKNGELTTAEKLEGWMVSHLADKSVVKKKVRKFLTDNKVTPVDLSLIHI